MSISPIRMRPVSQESERRRARLVLAIATIGIMATLMAYALAPGVRHAVGHAAHSVKGAVSGVLDHDKQAGAKKQTTSSTPTVSTPAAAGGSASPTK
ncbi:MAG TPA: hypothetical protein VII01_16665 [Solirubrobacteraceae bacterium]